MTNTLKDKIAIITGGSSGIGLATAQLFAKEGAKVVLFGRNEEKLIQAQNSIEGESLLLKGDTTKLIDLDRLYQKANERFGKIDIVFANAGIAKRAWLGDVDEKLFDHLTAVNFKGTYFTVQKSLAYLNPDASIILNASISGIYAANNDSLYSANKAAIIHLARLFAADLAPIGIRVNAISPGYTKTPLWNQKIFEDLQQYQSFCQEVPLQHRFCTPEEIAKSVLFLASDQSSYMTGQNLIIDGGLVMLKISDQKA